MNCDCTDKVVIFMSLSGACWMGSLRLLASWNIELSVESQDRESLEDCGKGKVVSFFVFKIFKILMALRPLRGRRHLCLTRCRVICASSTF